MCVAFVARLRVERSPKADHRIGPNHDGVGTFFRHRACFAMGVKLGDLPRGELFMFTLDRRTRHHLETEDKLPEQFHSPGRRRRVWS